MDKKQKQNLENLFKTHKFLDFKWIDPAEIIVSQWVRMKCMYGCNEYGKTAVCPPFGPTVDESRKFFDEYQEGIVFHFEKQVKKPEDRFAWTKEINQRLLNLEREVFLSGFQKTFLLFMDSCSLCKSCAEEKISCKLPKQSRPAPEALAVDVYKTVTKIGYPIKVLSDYSQTMNRYSFLLIE